MPTDDEKRQVLRGHGWTSFESAIIGERWSRSQEGVGDMYSLDEAWEQHLRPVVRATGVPTANQKRQALLLLARRWRQAEPRPGVDEERRWLPPGVQTGYGLTLDAAWRALQMDETNEAVREPAPNPTYEYRMLLLPLSAEPEEITLLIAGMNEEQRWRPVCFIPKYNLSDNRVQGHLLLEREKHG